MSITFERLQELLKQQNFHFLVDPERPALRALTAGLFGRYEFAIRLEFDGQFLQFRTIGLLSCPVDHPNLPAVLRTLGHINFERRLLKLGWDSSDGEIMAYADVALMDNDLTLEQLSRIMGIYFPAVDQAYERLRKAIETGSDPGDMPPREQMEARSMRAGEAEPEPKPTEPPIVEI